MNAAVLHSLGSVPRCESFPEPAAGEGEVVVEVRAASLKPVDRQLASGSHYASLRNLPAGRGRPSRRWQAGFLWRGTATVRRHGGAHRSKSGVHLSGSRKLR